MIAEYSFSFILPVWMVIVVSGTAMLFLPIWPWSARCRHVVGKVFALAWPIGRAHIVHTPDAFADVPDPS